RRQTRSFSSTYSPTVPWYGIDGVNGIWPRHPVVPAATKCTEAAGRLPHCKIFGRNSSLPHVRISGLAYSLPQWESPRVLGVPGVIDAWFGWRGFLGLG